MCLPGFENSFTSKELMWGKGKVFEIKLGKLLRVRRVHCLFQMESNSFIQSWSSPSKTMCWKVSNWIVKGRKYNLQCFLGKIPQFCNIFLTLWSSYLTYYNFLHTLHRKKACSNVSETISVRHMVCNSWHCPVQV